MANTISSLSYANTFGHWLAATSELITENNTLAKEDYIKDSGTLYLSESTLNSLQANGHIIAQKGLLVQGVGSYASIQNNLTVAGQSVFSNTGLSLTTMGTANVGTTLNVLGSGVAMRVANSAQISGNLSVVLDADVRILEARQQANTGNLSVTGTTVSNNIKANNQIYCGDTIVSNVGNTSILTNRIQANTSIRTSSIQANTVVNTQTLSVTTTSFTNDLQANSSVNTSNASIVNTTYTKVLQANTSVNTETLSVTTNTYTDTLIANTLVYTPDVYIDNSVTSNIAYVNQVLYAEESHTTSNGYINQLFANDVFVRGNTAIENELSSDTAVLGSYLISPATYSIDVFSDNFEANVGILTPTVSVEGTAFMRVAQANSSVNTSNASVVNTTYTKFLVANSSTITANAFVTGKTSTDILQANTSANTQTLRVTQMATVGQLQANEYSNTSNASVVNTTYTKFLVANTEITTPKITISGNTQTNRLQSNIANTQNLFVTESIDANSASIFVNNIQIQNELRVGGNFVIDGTTVYNSNTFTLNDNSTLPDTSYFSVNRGPGSTNAAIRWNEQSKFFDIISVASNNYYRIVTNEYLTSSLTSTSTSNVATAAAANSLNSIITAANNFLQAAVVATGSYANSAFDAANTADGKAVTSGNYANSAFAHANAAYQSANNVAPQIEPAFTQANAAFLKANSVIASVRGTSGFISASDAGITLNSNNGITINSTGANTLTISTAQDLRTTASPTFAAATLTSPLAPSSGGTGRTSLASSFGALVSAAAGSGTSGYVLSTNGSGNYSWVSAPTGGGGGSSVNPGTTIVSSRMSYPGDSSNTKFNTPTFNDNNQVRVYINGLRQLEDQYDLFSSNSKIILSNPPQTGDTLLVEVDGYAVYEYFANNIAYGPLAGSMSGSVTSIQDAIDDLESRKMPKVGGTFTGDVVGLTMDANTGNTSFATTQFVKNVLNTTQTTSGVVYSISTSGNAGTVTNGVYTNQQYSNPSWLTAVANTKITGIIADNQMKEVIAASSFGNAANTVRFSVDTKGRVTSSNSVPIAITSSQITDWPTFVASATTDTTNAGNISSGTLPNARLSDTGVVAGTYGAANRVATITVDAKGRTTFAAGTPISITKSQISDWPVFATSALTDTTNASNIISGTLSAARLPDAYLSLASGGTIASNLTIGTGTGQGGIKLNTTGDIYAYRTGGTTGVIFLNNTGSKYLYNDDAWYYLPSQGLKVNGAAVTTSAGSPETIVGTYNFRSTVGVGYGGQSGTLVAYGSGSASDSASMSFHRPGAYAINLGLDSDNVFRLGGWSSGWRWHSDASGNFTATGNITAYSDARLKTKVETITNALETVGKMRGVTYERIDNGEQGVGVIAQEMKEVLPQVVMDSPLEDGYMSVSYGNVVGVLIEAIKELKAEIEVLKGQIK